MHRNAKGTRRRRERRRAGAACRGRLVEKWFPNGINAQYAWNPDNTLARVRNRLNYSDSYVLSQHDYSYNGVGQRSQALEKLGVHTPPPMDEAYAYDPLGNRQGKNDGTTPLHYLHDAANQLLEARAGSPTGPLVQAYVHDANGNLTRKCAGGAVTRSATHCTGASVTTLAYDALDRLVQADQDGLVSHYAYDHAGRRIRKTVAGATVNYLYNGPDILAEYGSWGKADASYVHGPATDDPLLRVTAANDVSYHHADGLGSIVAHTDATSNLTAAQLYDAWGQPHPSARLGSLGQYGYTGREPDETGLMYYRARYYDPAIGRFTQRDPLGMPDGVNRYSYVGNNPVNYTDPTGEVANFVVGAIYGGVAGLVGGAISGYAANGSTLDAVKGAGLGLFAGAATGTVAPWLSNRAGAAAASLGLARGVGTVTASATVGGTSSAAGQLSGNVATGQPLGTNFSWGAVGGSAVGAPLAMLPAKIVGNAAATTVGTNVTWGSRSLTIVTPTVQHTGSTFQALTEGAIGGVFEAGGQAIENMLFPATPTGAASSGSQTLQGFQQLSSPSGAYGGPLLNPNEFNTNMMQSVYGK